MDDEKQMIKATQNYIGIILLACWALFAPTDLTAQTRVSPQNGMISDYSFITPNASSKQPYQVFDISKLKVVADPYSKTTMKLDLSGYDVGSKWSGEPNDSADTEIVTIHYRVDKIRLLTDYMDNARQLGIIDRTFSNVPLMEDMDFVVIIGAASPEGYTDRNAWLGANRALALKSYIMWKHPYINRDRLLTFSAGENWDGLVWMVEQDPDVPHRKKLLNLLSQDLTPDTKRLKIQSMGNGTTYEYLKKKMLPYLRGGTACMIYFKKDRKEEPQIVKDTVVVADTIYIEKIVYDCSNCFDRDDTPKAGKRDFIFAVKNNLLYDAALLPNLAVEVPFGKNYRWSVEVEGHWSWWNTNATSYNYHRIQMAGVELRRWFANKTGNPLNGWHAGLYGYGGTYDVRLFTNSNDDKGYLSNWSYSAGLSIGYAKPIGKRFNLEFGLGFGYFGGEYKKYDVSDCRDNTFPWLSTHNRKYIGLTKAKVSLVWIIGSKTNKR